MTRSAIRVALLLITAWLAVLAMIGVGVVILHEPPAVYFGLLEWIINALAFCVAYAGGVAAIHLWRQRPAGRASALVALILGAAMFTMMALQVRVACGLAVLAVLARVIGVALCGMGIAVLSNQAVAAELRGNPD